MACLEGYRSFTVTWMKGSGGDKGSGLTFHYSLSYELAEPSKKPAAGPCCRAMASQAQRAEKGREWRKEENGLERPREYPQHRDHGDSRV